ncbi:heterokaryon incompatibility protein-domain-containing protein [Neurospora crassa]|nr:heterokaryon incompatibility protein-domain-containing protein [Neurospora crassa]
MFRSCMLPFITTAAWLKVRVKKYGGRIRRSFAWKNQPVVDTFEHSDYQSPDERLCQECKRINFEDIFKPQSGIPIESWRCPYLFACFESSNKPAKVWRVALESRATCPLCAFFADCASRMGFTLDALSQKGFLTLGLRKLIVETYPRTTLQALELEYFSTSALELRIWRHTDPEGPWDEEPYSTDSHLILPGNCCSAMSINPCACEDFTEMQLATDTVNFEVIGEWLNNCESDHIACIDKASLSFLKTVPGLHFIDCLNGSVVPAQAMADLRYVTLSYVWGNSRISPDSTGPSATTAPILPETSKLPKVVSDTMKVVLGLGYRYLWVDRYCVPQNDHAAKRIQIHNMGNVYAMSALTIIAAAGENADYGLPGVSSVQVPQLWASVFNGHKKLPVVYYHPPHRDVIGSKWATRGWTYQEGVLSKRRLIFSDRHVFFQCQRTCTAGGLLGPRKLRLPLKDGTEASVMGYVKTGVMLPCHDDWEHGEMSFWARVTEFSGRTLSYDTDALNAIEGILTVFMEKSDVKSLYGLPISSPEKSRVLYGSRMPSTIYHIIDPVQGVLLSSLFWKSRWRKTPSLPSPDHITSNETSHLRRAVFPSWTWAGWKSSKSHTLIASKNFPRDQYRTWFTTSSDPVRIQFCFNGRLIDWKRNNIKRILDLDMLPDYIVITGTVFDTTVRFQTSNPSRPPVWTYESPEFWKGETDYSIPPGLFPEVEGSTQTMLGLFFFTVTTCMAGPEPSRVGNGPLYRGFEYLLLRPVQDDVGGTVYERVASVAPSYPREFDMMFPMYSERLREPLRTLTVRMR